VCRIRFKKILEQITLENSNCVINYQLICNIDRHYIRGMISLQRIKPQQKRVLIYLLWTIFTVILHSDIQAQILNIEDPTLSLDSIKKNDLKLGFSLSGNFSQQQTMVYDATALTELVYHNNDKHQVLLNGQYITTGNNENSLINSGFIYLRYTPLFHSDITPQFFTQFQNDLNRGLIYRQLYGINIRWIAHQSESLQLTLASGIFSETEQWSLSGGNDFTQGKTSFHYNKLNENMRIFWQPNQNYKITWNQFLQFTPKLRSSINYRWSNQMSISISLTKKIAFQINFSSMYDTQPVISIPRFYFNSSYGVQLVL
jgi:hypothetical protein